jgi:hypothetical protein
MRMLDAVADGMQPYTLPPDGQLLLPVIHQSAPLTPIAHPPLFILNYLPASEIFSKV